MGVWDSRLAEAKLMESQRHPSRYKLVTMAPRTSAISPRQQEQTRAAIKTTQLVKRLQVYALGELDPDGDPKAEIDAGRLKAIEILLRKSLPDLSSVTHTGDPDAPIMHEVIQRIVDPTRDAGK